MEITPRQYGRLEMAAWALAKHSEHNEVCMVLSKGIMQVLDEIADRDDLDELGNEIPEICDVIGDGEREPDVPDWRDNANLSDKSDRSDKRGNRGGGARSAGTDGAARLAADDQLTRIRLTVAMHQGDTLSNIIKAIIADGTDLKTLAQVLGVNKARISEAKLGHARPSFKKIFTEILGCDGGTVSAGKRGAK